MTRAKLKLASGISAASMLATGALTMTFLSDAAGDNLSPGEMSVNNSTPLMVNAHFNFPVTRNVMMSVSKLPVRCHETFLARLR